MPAVSGKTVRDPRSRDRQLLAEVAEGDREDIDLPTTMRIRKEELQMNGSIELVEKLDAERWAANLAGDVDKLATLISDRLTFIHPTGKTDTKETFLSNLRAHNPYLKHELLDQRTVLLGDTAVITKSIRNTARRKPPENLVVVVDVISSAVWTKEGDDWRLIHYHTTFSPTT